MSWLDMQREQVGPSIINQYAREAFGPQKIDSRETPDETMRSCDKPSVILSQEKVVT